MLEVVAEHRISLYTNPVYGLDKLDELIHLAESGKMKGKGIVIVDSEQIEISKRNELDLV